MVSVEEVVWAYRLILGRDPENEIVIANATQFGSTDVLIREFLSSDEYRMRSFASLGSGATVDRLDEIRAFINPGAKGIEI